MLLLWQLQNCFEKMWGILRSMIKQVSPSLLGMTAIYRRQQKGWVAICDSEISNRYLLRDAALFMPTRKTKRWANGSVTGTILMVSVLQPYHSHGRSPWYIIFIMKANSDSIWKGRDQKSLTVSCFQIQTGKHSDFSGVDNETEKDDGIFLLKFLLLEIFWRIYILHNLDGSIRK